MKHMARCPGDDLIAQVEKIKQKYQDTPEPQWGPIGREVFERTYSRVKKDGSRETWLDMVARVVIGNCGFVDPAYLEENEVEDLFHHLYYMKILPGGRHLWATGVPNRNFVSNCFSSGWMRDRFSVHFTWTFSRLMEGGGVGSNYSDKFFRRFKPMKRKAEVHIVCEDKHADYEDIRGYLSEEYSQRWYGGHEVGDSREGWVEALQRLLDYYWLPDESEFLDEKDHLIFDVSRIRPKGSPLKQFGGTASGPSALVIMLKKINDLMNQTFEAGGKPNWKLAMELDHEIASCVVAGNIRRSARMSMKHWEDPDILEFINLKQDSQSHWTTNISVVVDGSFWRSLNRKNGQARHIMAAIAEGIYRNGEPGICDETFCNKDELLDPFFSTNPCVTEDTWVRTTEGARQVRELKGTPFEAVINGKIYNSDGFWSTGKKPVYRVVTDQGYEVRVTANHRMAVDRGGKLVWVEAGDLEIGDALILNNHRVGEEREVTTTTFKEIVPEGLEEVFDCSVPGANSFEANGLLVHNCGEIPLPEWGSCNLGHVNLDHFAADHTGMLVAFKLMTRFLLRATFSDFPDPLTRDIVERDRRLGVGFTGFHYWLLRQGVMYSEYPSAEKVRKKLQEAHKLIRRVARDYAFEMRIAEPIKTTALAPTGTGSKLPGVSEGIQPIFSDYYIRRVRYGMSDPEQAEKVKRLKDEGYHVEKDAYSPNTEVASYICRDTIVSVLGHDKEHLIESSGEIAIADFLSVQAAVQEDFVDNAVSITVNFNSTQNSVDDIYESVRQHGTRLKGMTMMPSNHGFKQPPLEPITKEKYEELAKRIKNNGQNGKSLQEGSAGMECKNGVCELVTKNGEDESAPDLDTKKLPKRRLTVTTGEEEKEPGDSEK